MNFDAGLAIAFSGVLVICACAPSTPPETSQHAAPATTLNVPAPKPEPATDDPTASSEAGDRRSNSVELEGGVRIEDLRVGNGAAVEPNHRVSVHYVGTLTDGTVFDSSRARGQPFQIELGKNRLIKGFEAGLIGMRPGGLRRITIPPEQGYGSRAVGKIPPDSTLTFEVELLGIGGE